MGKRNFYVPDDFLAKPPTRESRVARHRPPDRCPFLAVGSVRVQTPRGGRNRRGLVNHRGLNKCHEHGCVVYWYCKTIQGTNTTDQLVCPPRVFKGRLKIRTGRGTALPREEKEGNNEHMAETYKSVKPRRKGKGEADTLYPADDDFGEQEKGWSCAWQACAHNSCGLNARGDQKWLLPQQDGFCHRRVSTQRASAREVQWSHALG